MSATMASLTQDRYRDWQSSLFPFPIPHSESLPGALGPILAHKSCRSFVRNKPLLPGTLETLLAAAQSGSTSSLFQTWDVVAIQDPENKDKVATLAGNQDFIRQAPLFLVFCPTLRRLDNLSKQYGQQLARALHNMDMFIMSTLDAAIAGQNVAVAAESLGLGDCYVGAVRNNAAQICELLNLPPLTWGAFGMAIGYVYTDSELSGKQIKPRLPMREILHMERWNEEGQKDNVASYDQSLGMFFYVDESKFERTGWSEFVASKVAPREQDGRENIRGTIERQGFKLE